MRPDWHQIDRLYERGRDGARSPVLSALAERPLQFDVTGIRAAWGEGPIDDRTVLAGVRRISGALPPPASRTPIATALEADVAELARRAPSPCLALGGGIDAAAVLCAWRASGAPLPAVATLQTGLPSYDEVDDAQQIAASLGAQCELVTVTPDELVECLPEAVRAAEAPLYNLHPVGRFALARELRRRGFLTLVTGDGADAALRGEPDLDYVPIVAALTRAAGLALASPFLEGATLAACLSHPDPVKGALRGYLTSRGVSQAIAGRAKRPRLLPDLDPGHRHPLTGLAELAERVGIPLTLSTERERTAWLTLALLSHSLEAAA